MPVDLITAISAVVDRLVLLSSEDAQFRAQLRQLAQAVLEATEVPDQIAPVRATTVVVDTKITTHEESLLVLADAEQVAPRESPAILRSELSDASAFPLPVLTLGRISPPVESTRASLPVSWNKTTSADIPLIIARCQLKAEAARWARTRRRLMSEGASFAIEIAPKDQDIINRAKAVPDCFLWMSHPNGPSPTDLRLYDDIAGCFETMADALSILKQIEDGPDLKRIDYEQSLDLLAEAQSALRAAIDNIDGQADSDQGQVFDWLKTTVGEKQIFIRHYMRADDPADPTKWADLSTRIDAIDSRIQKSRQQAKQRKKLLGKIRHKLSVIASDPQTADGNWQGIVEIVEELLAGGMPATNRELRELLAPAIDSLPEIPDLPKGFQLFIREIDRFLATSPTTATSAVTPSNVEIEKVAELLEGKIGVLIGGDCRLHAKDALKAAFRLTDLIWIETRAHESLGVLIPIVSRSDVAVVLLAIRWTSHSYGEIKEHCDGTGKPLVRLPSGYSPNQVASQILQQCSVQLEAKENAEASGRSQT